MRVLLDETAVIQLDSTGGGIAKIGPLSAREVWYPDRAEVKANQDAINEAECTVFVGRDMSISNFRDACVDGSAGDITGEVAGNPVKTGEYIWARWVGGDADVQATLRVVGTKDV